MAVLARVATFDGYLWADTFYSASFVSELRQDVPSRRRHWDRKRGLWRIDKRHGDVLEALLNKHYGANWRYVPPSQLGLFPDMQQQAPRKSVSLRDGRTNPVSVFVGERVTA